MYVALYARHSTDKQSRSTRDQIARLREFCGQHGYIVVEAFIDEAKSGADMQNRRGIRRLLDRAKENLFSRVICEDLSRLSRDQGDIAWIYKRLSFIPIAIETITEGLISELHIGLKGTMNALYLKDLADKTHRGVVASVQKGGMPGGRLYGYDIVRQWDEDGEPVRGLRKVNEGEAAIIRQIFADYADGKPLKTICVDLTVQGIPAPKGGQWAPTTLVGTASRKTGLLRQTLYKGIVTFNRMAYRKHPDTGKRLSVVRPENEWVSVPAPELAIVDTDLFDRVQAILENRSSLRHQRTVTNKVLSPEEKAARAAERQASWRAKQLLPRKNIHTIIGGRLHCGLHGKKIDHFYNAEPHGAVYGCPHKGCPNRNIKLNTTILPLAIAALTRIDGGAVEAYFASAEVESERTRHQAAIAQLVPQVEELRAEVANVIGALGRRARTEEIRSYFDTRSMEIRRLKLDIETLEEQVARLTKPDRLEDALNPYHRLVRRLKEAPTDRQATVALRPVVRRVTLYAEWDGQEWQRSARLDLDYDKLLKLSFAVA